MQPIKTTGLSREELLPTRWSLLSRLKNHDDQESWKCFFETYWQLIYGVALKAGLSEADAQDVVQETVVAVARNIGQFRTRPEAGSFKTWLLNITRWRILDHQRKHQRDQRLLAPTPGDTARTALIERVPNAGGDPLETIWNEEWERNLAAVALQRVKAQVSAKQFQIFDLYVLKQWPVLQVVKTLRIGPGQVYLAKHRVAALLRKEMKRLEQEDGNAYAGG